MRRRLAFIGRVLFVVGLVLFAAGVFEAKGELHSVSSFSLQSPGEYVSPELNLTQSSIVSIAKAPSTEGLVTTQNLSRVNSTNFAAEEIAPTSTTSTGTLAYSVPAGSYYVVYFGGSAPTTTVTYTYTNSVALHGLATLAGIVLAGVGGIAGLTGLFLKRVPPAPTTPIPSGARRGSLAASPADRPGNDAQDPRPKPRGRSSSRS